MIAQGGEIIGLFKLGQDKSGYVKLGQVLSVYSWLFRLCHVCSS
jgi:hypothetical protein